MEGECPIPGLRVAGPEDKRELQPLAVPMDDRWVAYLNARVLDAIRQTCTGRLTHLRFVPDPETGLLCLFPARSGQYGAVRLDYTPPETGATISLRLPLLRFGLERPHRHRQRVFPLKRQSVRGVNCLALDVAGSESRTARGKGREKAEV